MKFPITLNILEFFGILSPGVLLVMVALMCFVGMAHIFGADFSVATLSAIGTVLGQWKIFIIVTIFFISYLFGSIVRLFANDFAEVMSGIYLRVFRRRKDAYARERFPYPFVIKEIIGKQISQDILNWYKRKNPAFTDEFNKVFYNVCKADLYRISPARAEYHARIESFVRFLAGSLVSCVILFLASFPFAMYFLTVGAKLLASIYLVCASFSVFLICGILERFRHQHTREVTILWTSYYDASHEKAEKQSID